MLSLTYPVGRKLDRDEPPRWDNVCANAMEIVRSSLPFNIAFKINTLWFTVRWLGLRRRSGCETCL